MQDFSEELFFFSACRSGKHVDNCAREREVQNARQLVDTRVHCRVGRIHVRRRDLVWRFYMTLLPPQDSFEEEMI